MNNVSISNINGPVLFEGTEDLDQVSRLWLLLLEKTGRNDSDGRQPSPNLLVEASGFNKAL